jgi:Zn-dependent protease
MEIMGIVITEEIIKITGIIIALLVAIIGHEIMHGLVAHKFGDNTAKDLGRLSPNPIVHIDPVGSILLPAILFFAGSSFLFGWAKPVPINMRTVIINRGTNGAIMVALAGIAYNFSLAIIFAIIYNMLDKPIDAIDFFIHNLVFQLVLLNTILGFFNLWPIPPLDGSQALKYFAIGNGWNGTAKWLDKVYPYGMFILIAIIATPLGNIFFAPIKWLLQILL